MDTIFDWKVTGLCKGADTIHTSSEKYTVTSTWGKSSKDLSSKVQGNVNPQQALLPPVDPPASSICLLVQNLTNRWRSGNTRLSEWEDKFVGIPYSHRELSSSPVLSKALRQAPGGEGRRSTTTIEEVVGKNHGWVFRSHPSRDGELFVPFFQYWHDTGFFSDP